MWPLPEALKASNFLFDADRRIQIVDFSQILREIGGSFSGEGQAQNRIFPCSEDKVPRRGTT
jgi:hypothetical protein